MLLNTRKTHYWLIFAWAGVHNHHCIQTITKHKMQITWNCWYSLLFVCARKYFMIILPELILKTELPTYGSTESVCKVSKMMQDSFIILWMVLLATTFLLWRNLDENQFLGVSFRRCECRDRSSIPDDIEVICSVLDSRNNETEINVYFQYPIIWKWTSDYRSFWMVFFCGS